MKRRRFLILTSLGLIGLFLGGRQLMQQPPKAGAEFRRAWMDPGPLRPLETSVKGLRMFALASIEAAPPDAPAIVLVHGSGLSHRYMIPAGEKLTPYLKVYMPDMPGYGRSGKPDEVYNVPELADWLVAWMSSIGLERASFLGNSFGCQVIADLAVRHPGRVDRAILQGPTTPSHERSAFWQFIRWRQNAPFNPPWISEVVNEAYKQAGWWRMFRSFFIQIGDPIEAKMSRIQAPVLIVRGSEDPIAGQEWCERLAALCPRGWVAVIPGVAHTLCFTAPVPLARVTRDFIL
jgi:2-hydroxy-6-oxonona-2,4-dienedioate hydrolase